MLSESPPTVRLGAGLCAEEFNKLSLYNKRGDEQRCNYHGSNDRQQSDRRSFPQQRSPQSKQSVAALNTNNSYTNEDEEYIPMDFYDEYDRDQVTSTSYASTVEDLVLPFAGLKVSPSLPITLDARGQSTSTESNGGVSLVTQDDELSPHEIVDVTVFSIPGSRLPPLSFAKEIHHTHHAPSTEPGPLTRIDIQGDPLELSPCPMPFNSASKSDSRKLNPQSRRDQFNAEKEKIAHQLRHWAFDRHFLEHAHSREERNPFPNVNQNYGWNRARCDGFLHFSELYDGTGVNVPELVRTAQCFKEYSLWSQVQPWRIDDACEREWKKVFGIVFVGIEGEGACRWVRKPGTWWGIRRGVLSPLAGVHRNKSFGDWVDYSVDMLRTGVAWWSRWKTWGAETHECQLGKLKRKIGPEEHGGVEMDADGREKAKKPRLGNRIPTKVMSDKWRARRRAQEKRAGRWTDGTLRMDRMWAEFHWVLNVEEPWDAHWKREYGEHEVAGYNMWPQHSFSE